jgi:hypothetical protein
MIVEQFSQEINNKNKLPQPASGRYKKKKKWIEKKNFFYIYT